jgi:hypothetical protein
MAGSAESRDEMEEQEGEESSSPRVLAGTRAARAEDATGSAGCSRSRQGRRDVHVRDGFSGMFTFATGLAGCSRSRWGRRDAPRGWGTRSAHGPSASSRRRIHPPPYGEHFPFL